MTRARSRFVCGTCGEAYLRWKGQCRACGAWNSLVETIVREQPRSTRASTLSSPSTATALSEIDSEVVPRWPTACTQALSGSTNAIIHLVAMAGRAGVALPLARFDEIAARTPVLANVRPAGKKYLMEDFYYAGGLRALLAEIRDLLNVDCLTVNGRTLGENLAGARIYDDDVIRRRANPVAATGGLAVLRGILAPDGAVIKPTAAEPRLLQHTGPAVVFRDYNEMAARIDDPALAVDENSVLGLSAAATSSSPPNRRQCRSGR